MPGCVEAFCVLLYDGNFMFRHMRCVFRQSGIRSDDKRSQSFATQSLSQSSCATATTCTPSASGPSWPSSEDNRTRAEATAKKVKKARTRVGVLARAKASQEGRQCGPTPGTMVSSFRNLEHVTWRLDQNKPHFHAQDSNGGIWFSSLCSRTDCARVRCCEGCGTLDRHSDRCGSLDNVVA